MEKFSAYRDPGTGIQPFLPSVPPVGSEALAKVLFPIGCVIGAVRTLLVITLGVIYTILVKGALILLVIPPLHRIVTFAFTSLITRLVLLLLGLWWIPVEPVTRKRGRSIKISESWNPGAGDVIVSNWASWIEILWLAFRFNPIFVIPVFEAIDIAPPDSNLSSPVTRTPGRRTGTGSANISSPNRVLSARKPILGFCQVSLFAMLHLTGQVPPYNLAPEKRSSLDEIRHKADRPVVIFPECTTSNGRGMLRFADIFRGENMPVKKYIIFIMCVRYDPPTLLAHSLTQPIPSLSLNPFPHLFNLTTSVMAPALSIRLLSPSESPSSGSFIVSDVVSNYSGDDHLTEACACLIAQIGKMKRTGMGWEDKAAFLQFYRGKRT